MNFLCTVLILASSSLVTAEPKEKDGSVVARANDTGCIVGPVVAR